MLAIQLSSMHIFSAGFFKPGKFKAVAKFWLSG